GPQRDHDPAEVDRALLVNVAGVANGTRAFTRAARTWPPARRVLVNVSSGAARTSYEGWSVYGATKAAVEHLTDVVALEEPDVACHAVSPGVVETDMQVRIRTLDEATFPSVERFRRLHAEGGANSPAWVADHLAGLLLGTLEVAEVAYRVPAEPA
ncbi:MAG TPA: SDR family NAD(P)-dependent oxidoreductase, partial [Aquihabitans sp.]|nr:SDR family NAD(P)-dependent oxidoreductase [Aquihabitans sp.]